MSNQEAGKSLSCFSWKKAKSSCLRNKSIFEFTPTESTAEILISVRTALDYVYCLQESIDCCHRLHSRVKWSLWRGLMHVKIKIHSKPIHWSLSHPLATKRAEYQTNHATFRCWKLQWKLWLGVWCNFVSFDRLQCNQIQCKCGLLVGGYIQLKMHKFGLKLK